MCILGSSGPIDGCVGVALSPALVAVVVEEHDEATSTERAAHADVDQDPNEALVGREHRQVDGPQVEVRQGPTPGSSQDGGLLPELGLPLRLSPEHRGCGIHQNHQDSEGDVPDRVDVFEDLKLGIPKPQHSEHGGCNQPHSEAKSHKLPYRDVSYVHDYMTIGSSSTNLHLIRSGQAALLCGCGGPWNGLAMVIQSVQDRGTHDTFCPLAFRGAQA